MALYVTEHVAWYSYRQGGVNQQINGNGAYNISSAATGNVSLQAGTKYVRVCADAATAMLLNTAGLLSTVLTSTNSYRISPNGLGEWFSVSTALGISAKASTS